MKPKRNIAKAPEHKILGEQAEKLKGKLDQLKEQIKRKKEEKQMNKTSTSIYSQNSKAFENRITSAKTTHQARDPLHQELKSLKMEGIAPKLKEYNIHSLQDLQAASSEEIDQWKNVPVGYRIKLKKYIEQERSKVKNSELKEMEFHEQGRNQAESMLDIEAIVKNRKAQAVFVPINRIKDTEEEEQAQQHLEEDEEELMIMSIMQAFRPKQRASSLKNNSKTEKKHVHWSPQVDQMERDHPHLKSYPKQKISRKVFHQKTEVAQTQAIHNKSEKTNVTTYAHHYEMAESPDHKYCWVCLKLIQSTVFSIQNRDFCSAKCLQGYQISMKAWEIINIEEKECFLQTIGLEKSNEKSVQDEVNFEIV